MEVHMAKRYRLMGIGRYRHVREIYDSITRKRIKIETPNFVYKEIESIAINFNFQNRNPRQVVYTKFQLWKPIPWKRLELRSSNFVCKEI